MAQVQLDVLLDTITLYSFERTAFLKDDNISTSGDHAGGVPPVPIPNTEVKTSRADDTWGVSPWESRSSPGKTSEKAISNEIVFSVLVIQKDEAPGFHPFGDPHCWSMRYKSQCGDSRVRLSYR